MRKFTAVLCLFLILFSPLRAFAEDDPEILRYDAMASQTEIPVDILSVMAGRDSFVSNPAGPENFDIPCRNAILVEENTGRVLYAKNSEDCVPMASITKIMTLILVMEAIESGKITYNDIVPVSKHAFETGGSQIWLEPGEQLTVDEMIKAVTVASANDAAVALAEFVGGSEEAFCRLMNDKAKALGMENTHFVNACGLDAEGHYSSATDVSIMARELMKHKDIFKYSGIWLDYLRNGQTQLVNTNKLLKSYNGITGLKTGTTSKAGVCICATAQRNDLSLVAVVLGANSGTERFAAAKTLLDFGFQNFETKAFPETTDLPVRLPVKFGTEDFVGLECQRPEKLLFAKGATSNLTCKVDLPESISAPVTKGMRIGTLSLYSEGGKIARYDIIATENTDKMDFKKALAILTNKAASM